MEDFRNYQVKCKDLAENSIELNWIPLWDKVSRVPLNDKMANYLISICMMSEEDAKRIVDECVVKGDFMVQIVHKSMKARFNMKMDYKLTLYLSLLLESPGDAVMFFAYLKYKMHERNLDELTFDEFHSIFPIGYPTSEERQWLWDCQKVKFEEDDNYNEVPCGNMLDISKCYKSFYLIQ